MKLVHGRGLSIHSPTGFMVKDRGILGSRPGDLKILNRTLRWVVAQNRQKSRTEDDADDWHVPLLCAPMQMIPLTG
eukprot:2333824-Amphidinium_carterae.1